MGSRCNAGRQCNATQEKLEPFPGQCEAMMISITIINKFTSAVTSLFKKSKPTAEVEPIQSDRYSEVASQAQSESLFNYDVFKVENDRRSVLADVQKLLDEDPRVAEANKRMANAATRGGITVVVSGASTDVQARNKKARPEAAKVRPTLMRTGHSRYLTTW